MDLHKGFYMCAGPAAIAAAICQSLAFIAVFHHSFFPLSEEERKKRIINESSTITLEGVRLIITKERKSV